MKTIERIKQEILEIVSANGAYYSTTELDGSRYSEALRELDRENKVRPYGFLGNYTVWKSVSASE